MIRTERLEADPEAVSAPPRREFESILSAAGEPAPTSEQPAYFTDLNLDQIVEAIVAGRDEYELRPFFNGPLLRDPDAVHYRHEVFRELGAEQVHTTVHEFADGMRSM